MDGCVHRLLADRQPVVRPGRTLAAVVRAGPGFPGRARPAVRRVSFSPGAPAPGNPPSPPRPSSAADGRRPRAGARPSCAAPTCSARGARLLGVCARLDGEPVTRSSLSGRPGRVAAPSGSATWPRPRRRRRRAERPAGWSLPVPPTSPRRPGDTSPARRPKRTSTDSDRGRSGPWAQRGVWPADTRRVAAPGPPRRGAAPDAIWPRLPARVVPPDPGRAGLAVCSGAAGRRVVVALGPEPRRRARCRLPYVEQRQRRMGVVYRPRTGLAAVRGPQALPPALPADPDFRPFLRERRVARLWPPQPSPINRPGEDGPLVPARALRCPLRLRRLETGALDPAALATSRIARPWTPPRPGVPP